MSKPAVSVVITSYATPAALLGASLDSLLGQTLDDIEVVLVVDGELATASEELVSMTQAKDDRLVVVRPGRVGRAWALNVGLSAASAPFIGIQDADDASHPRRLEIQMDLLAREPELALLGTGARITVSTTDGADWFVPSEVPPVRRVGRAVLRSNPIVHSSVLARRSALDAVGGYDESRRAQFDYDLFLRLHAAGFELGICDLPLVLHRRHPDQFFEGLAPARRAWGSYRLQLSHIARLAWPEKVLYSGIACGRLAYQVGRGVAWHQTSRRRRQHPR
jgi:teichuronic acid biosynthesis glycosyltransferase TuaG